MNKAQLTLDFSPASVGFLLWANAQILALPANRTKGSGVAQCSFTFTIPEAGPPSLSGTPTCPQGLFEISHLC